MLRIVFLVHKGKEYTVRKYLASWGQSLSHRIEIRHYHGLRSTGRTVLKRLEHTVRAWRVGRLKIPKVATGDQTIYVFTDIDRLDERETRLAERLYESLEHHPDTALLINHPRTSMRRFELLQELHSSGINDFGVYRAEPVPRPQRWPVFLRDENDHGFMSELIHDQEELEQQLAGCDRRGDDMAAKIVVEFCDCSDSDGVIRKYGAFRVGNEIIARQIHFSRSWVVRFPDIATDDSAREELDYVQSNPHRAELMKIFELSGIRYGRVDYSLAEGRRIQVFEINTNPMILIPADRFDRARFAAHDTFGKTLGQALTKLGA